MFVLLLVVASSASVSLTARAAGGAAQASGNDALAPDPAPIQRAYSDRLGAHDAVYFIYGGEAPGAKFQVSGKYRVLTFAPRGAPQPQTLQFGYTQRSLWDIAGKSSPFYDTSYMPELFCESVGGLPSYDPGRLSWQGYQFGYGHESNGGRGDNGRSLNRLYARSSVAFALPADWHIIVAPQLFTYAFSLNDNPRIRDYRSYGMLQVGLGRRDGPSLFYTGQVGRHFKNPTHQLDLTVPARVPWFDLLAILMVQYFHGYGESLLSYEQRADMLRAGFSLVR